MTEAQQAVPGSGGYTATRNDPPESAVIDLLGVLAYGELSAFDRMAADARWAPTLGGRVALSAMATAEMGHFQALARHLEARGVAVEAAMTPFIAPFNAFHDSTAPHSWLESLVKAHVGDGLAADFYREIAAFVDADTRNLVHEVLAAEDLHAFIVAQVRQGTEQDVKLAGRLSLWGRRLVGEALSQAQRVAADRDALTSLLTGTVDRPGMDLAAISRMFSRLVANHTKRMAELGLQA